MPCVKLKPPKLVPMDAQFKIYTLKCFAAYTFAKVWFWLAVVAGVLVLLLGCSNVRAAFSQARLVRL